MLPLAILHLFEQKSEHQVLKALDALLLWAFKEKVSDIHIEPQQNELRIRVRIDGLMFVLVSLSLRYEGIVLSKLKMMAHLDIAERRAPQDGRFEIHLEGECINGRLNTCPVLFGEKAVIRLLSLSAQCMSEENLGMSPVQLRAVQSVLSSPHGLVIVTGPTGSGKTMTLYSFLMSLNTGMQNIISVEDPVEHVIPGMNQIQIQEKAGVSFHSILRSLLRQDPDVLMIGEIRDAETAELAIKAAETGHLVLSTLHTESARQAIPRLQGLGIPQYLVLETVRLLIAQRLLRTYCLICLGMGCSLCISGFRGRSGIFEILSTQDGCLLDTYVEGLDLKQSGLLKVSQGLTHISELNRVL